MPTTPADVPATHRLFWAVLPPSEVVDELAAQVVDNGLRTSWTPRAQWHVTLLFTPHVAPGAVAPLVEDVGRRVAGIAPFELSVRGGGAFPELGAARHLVALLDDPTGTLPVLHHACSEAATALGIGHEQRPYQPHLTLARVSPAADRTPDASWLAAITTRRWVVDEAVLVQSVLDGPRHTARHQVVERVPLG